ncbi:MAG TPA: tetratricopeptide repeat protein [Bacteroidales bacterium]|nr:tetratricopeptide repeat protein [Bacteroidales bacterium]HPS16543.1 tetratricopeptide repeat protein [Bacteroidales bacterium]
MKKNNPKYQPQKNISNQKKTQSIPVKKNNTVLFAVIAFCLPVLLYIQTLNFGFTYFDDDGIIINNIGFLDNFKNISKAFYTDAFVTGISAFYRPLQTLSFMTDMLLSGGNNAWMYHFTNILFFGFISFMIYQILKKFSISSSLVLLATLIYCVHPLFVSSVAWLPARGDLQLMFFSLLSFLFLIKFLNERKNIFLFIHWLAFSIALFCKETAAFLPFIFVIYFFAFHFEKRFDKKYFIIIFLYAVSGIFWFWMRDNAVGNYSNPVEVTGFAALIANMQSIPEAMINFFLPFDFSPIPEFSFVKTLSGLIIIAMLIYVFIKNKERNFKEKIFCVSWFVLFMLPPMLYKHPYLDYMQHRFFLPLFGMLLFLLFVIPRKWLVNGKIKRSWILIAIIIFFSSFTFMKSRPYVAPLTFYNSAIKHNPNSAIAYYNRGYVKTTNNDYEGALNDYNKVIEICPTYVEAYYSRGLTKAELNDVQGAIEDYTKAVSLSPDYFKAYYGRGNVKQNSGDLQGAIEDFNKAISLEPDYADAYNNRGLAKANLGNYSEAIVDYNKTISINPSFDMAYYNRGCAKNLKKEFNEAIEDFNKAISIRADFAEAYNNKGVSYYSLGNYNEAVSSYNKAIEINSKYTDAYFNRALAKYQLKDFQGATNDCDKVLELFPDNKNALSLKMKIEK